MSSLRQTLQPEPGAELSPAPWSTEDDGTIVAADGHVVCVLGCPEDDLQEQDVTNGAAILALPDLLASLDPMTLDFAADSLDRLQAAPRIAEKLRDLASGQRHALTKAGIGA